MTPSEQAIERIKKAIKSGVKANAIAEKTGITYFRIYSRINPKSYTGADSFTDEEVNTINKALDEIKTSF